MNLPEIDEQKLALCDLKGTDGQYLLDPRDGFGLRQPCNSEWCDAHDPIPGWASECPICDGCGWVPSPDLWSYIRAGWTILMYISPYTDVEDVDNAFQDSLDKGQDPGPACFKAVAGALLGKTE